MAAGANEWSAMHLNFHFDDDDDHNADDDVNERWTVQVWLTTFVPKGLQ